jgi:hypothetical protein
LVLIYNNRPIRRYVTAHIVGERASYSPCQKLSFLYLYITDHLVQTFDNICQTSTASACQIHSIRLLPSVLLLSSSLSPYLLFSCISLYLIRPSFRRPYMCYEKALSLYDCKTSQLSDHEPVAPTQPVYQFDWSQLVILTHK